MRTTLSELIESIGYSDIDITVETPIANLSFAMEVDHISKTERGYYIEGSDGYFLEIADDSEIMQEGKEYYISKGDCYICIKFDA